MADSFIIQPDARKRGGEKSRTVLVTGAAGRIGSYFAEHSADRYDLTLMDHPDADMSGLAEFGRVVQAPLGDLAALKKHFAGQDTVVHLAANPSAEATWDSVLQDNITGTYHAFVAAAAAGCRRVVYASSVHAISGYPVDRQVQSDDPVNPGDLYGVSKCFGEAMARFMATQHGLSSIAIRIGAFQPPDKAEEPDSVGLMNTFVSDRDLTQLIQCCIDDQTLQFAIFPGLSDNVFNRMNIADARELVGYQPMDDLTAANPRLAGLKLGETIQPHSEQRGQRSGTRKQM